MFTKLRSQLTGAGGCPIKLAERTSYKTQPIHNENRQEMRFPPYPPLQIARYLRAPFPPATIPELTSRFQGHKLAIRERGLLRSFPRGCGLVLIGN